MKRERKRNLALISFVANSAVRCEHVRCCLTSPELGMRTVKGESFLFWFEQLRKQGSLCVPIRTVSPQPLYPSSSGLIHFVFSGNDCLREKLSLEEDGRCLKCCLVSAAQVYRKHCLSRVLCTLERTAVHNKAMSRCSICDRQMLS